MDALKAEEEAMAGLKKNNSPILSDTMNTTWSRVLKS